MKFLTDKDLAFLTEEEYDKYLNRVKSEYNKLLYTKKHPECKHSKRLQAIRDGKDPDEWTA